MTTYYFIRHAQKERNGQRNPHLTKLGKSQARHWAEVLAPKGIDLIFCTPLRRTQETAAPLAQKLGLQLQIYNPTDLYNESFKAQTQDKTVLVVGHQDTTPAFINRILKERRYGFIESHNHGNLYKVSLDEHGKAQSTLTNIKF